MADKIFNGFDFSLLGTEDFKEDSVREEIILPLLRALGYRASGPHKIIRSKALKHPVLTVGSQTRPVTLIPDYLLTANEKYAWVLDAKAPQELITSGSNVEQTYSYAIHPEIRVDLYALCNGREFIVFKINEANPVLYFQLSELNQHWDKMMQLLTPTAFEKPAEVTIPVAPTKAGFDYTTVKPLPEIKTLLKQSASRHYGVHPYFTKQVWNVVQEYIKNFTQPGDTVLDPFGGTGVTAVEAIILGRKGIHIDLNPLSIFLVENLLAPVDLDQFSEEYQKIKRTFEKKAPQTDEEIEKFLSKYPYPKGIKLPADSDVSTIEQLFTRKQLAQLAYLKYLIKKVKDKNIHGTLMLMFSGLINKVNLTYHASEGRSEGRGDSGVFRYYRYRIAPNPANLDMMTYFESRFKKVIAAKKELAPFINTDTLKNAQIYKGTATDLKPIPSESVDYIYTDPPYGKKIAYLDLSTMWNAWLDLPVTPQDFELEAIEGGELDKSKDDYSNLLSQSIEEMYRVLKFDRWMSFVFAHKDPAYWHIIVETAEKAGFEYKGAVSQSNNKTSFKKRQNPFTVLSGQLIINFRKVKNPKAILKVGVGANIAHLVIETIEGIIARNEGATIEEINDQLIIKGLELGFLDILSKEYQDLTPLLSANFTYDTQTEKYYIPQNTKFKSRIDLNLRVRYYIISYLRRMAHQNHYPTFDEIVLYIMPLLKNGVTPEHQTILSVLEDVASRTGNGGWKLNETGQMQLL